MEEQISQLELLCQQLYESSDITTRQQAEKTLVAFSESPNSLPQCQILLERSQSPYALLLASSTLTKIVTGSTSSLTPQDRLQLRNYVLHYMTSRVGLAGYVTQSLVQLIARITKHGWFDTDKTKMYIFRDLLDEVGKFLQGSVQHCEIGIQILTELVQEMNTVESTRSIAKHRKVAGSFRDEMLYNIFTLSCTLLRQINIRDDQQHNLIGSLLKLSCSCLSFDFIGNSSDESSDDLSTVHIPTAWRPLFVDFSTLQLFFGLTHSLPPKLAASSVSCLVLLASTRRSLFGNSERGQYLEQLVKGVQGLLEASQPLTDPECYHEFCRLLVRLKSNYQLGELMKLEDYPQFIQLVAKFTITSLQSWQFSANSVYYLLCLWQRMVASVPFIRSQDTHLLNTYVPEIAKMYITSRLDCVEGVVTEGMDDPLDDETALGQQLDQLSIIAKCDYQNTCELLVTLFDTTASSYQQTLQTNPGNDNELRIREGQLAWLVHMIGHVMGVRISHSSTASYDTMDGQLVCRVLQLMDLTDAQLPQRGNEHLDLALIGFFEQFRKIYIGEMIHKSTQVYRMLGERLGLNDETTVLNVIVRKIVTNLKLWTRSRSITIRTLQLLQDLSVGFTSVRKLVKLESIQFILDNHTSEQFPFLSIAAIQVDMRCRTMFYTALGRLLLVELREDEEKLRQFMSPITSILEQLQSLMSTPQQLVSEQQIKHMVVGCTRDLRGILIACNTKQSYVMFFDWFYPTYVPIFLDALRLWYLDPFVTSPTLKLMAELAQNRSQRLMFDVTSPKGVLLFREASKTIVTYGTCILSLNDVPESEVYARKLKGVSICFNILRSTLFGSYVNFGVMKLYGDTALDDALSVFVKLVISLPLKHLLDYPKLSIAYYTLLETLTQYHMEFISSLEPDVIIYLLSSISEGLTALDSSVCTGCCSTLDHILTYIFKKRNKPKSSLSPADSISALLQLPEARPEILQDMLSSILNTVMFEKCRVQWSMSRPLLGLILLNEEYFKTLHDRVVSLQPPERQNAMVLCFDNLMDGIEYNLAIRNRDKFTQNLSVFRRDLTISPKDISTVTPTSDMMT